MIQYSGGLASLKDRWRVPRMAPTTAGHVLHHIFRLGPMHRRDRLRSALNWMNGSTLLGLAAAKLVGCELRPASCGLIFAHHYSPRLPKASAFTVGNVVLFRAGPEVVARRPRLVEHEARHCTQYALCFGLPFLPAYFLAAGASWLLTGDPASRNVFERGAGLQEGGYVERPLRAALTRRVSAPRRLRSSDPLRSRHSSGQ